MSRTTAQQQDAAKLFYVYHRLLYSFVYSFVLRLLRVSNAVKAPQREGKGYVASYMFMCISVYLMKW